MRAAWILGVLTGLALGFSCILPAATLDAGTGGGTGSSTGTMSSSSSGLPTAKPLDLAPGLTLPPVKAASGNPTQRHLIHAAGTWWLFYLEPSTKHIAIRTSEKFDMWTNISPITSSLSPTQLDGRQFGVDTAKVGTAEIVHLTMTAGGMQPRIHARGLAIPGHPSKLVFDPVAVVAVQSTAGPDGATTVIATDGRIIDLSSSIGCDTDAGALLSECSLIYAQTDDGGAWAADPGAVTSLGMDFTSPTMLTLLPLGGGDVVSVWQAAGELRYAHFSPPAMNTGQGKALTVFSSPAEKRRWAACVQPSTTARGAMPHVLWWTASGFAHATTTTGDTWSTVMDKLPTPPDTKSVDELFLACDRDRVFAFTIAGASQNLVVGATWDEASGAWSGWSTVVSNGNPAPRCFLSGFDRVVDGHEIGLIWSQTCDDTSVAQIYGARLDLNGP
jgi:hypothetical protein